MHNREPAESCPFTLHISQVKCVFLFSSSLHAKRTFNLLQIMIHWLQCLSSWQEYSLVSMHKIVADGVRMQECDVQLFSRYFYFSLETFLLVVCNSVTSVIWNSCVDKACSRIYVLRLQQALTSILDLSSTMPNCVIEHFPIFTPTPCPFLAAFELKENYALIVQDFQEFLK